MMSFTFDEYPGIWKMALTKYGISVREVAKRTEVNLPHLYNVLNAKASPTLAYSSKIESVIAQVISERENMRMGGSQTSQDLRHAATLSSGESNENRRDTQQ